MKTFPGPLLLEALVLAALASMPAASQNDTYQQIDPKYPPDLTAGPTVSVAGKSAPWKGGEIIVDAAKATKKYAIEGGQCLFPVTYQVRNIGALPSGKFTVLFKSGATDVTADSFDSIPPGGAKTKVLTVVFKAGAQSLGLKVDQGDLVKEGNEKNNSSGIRFRVTGSCLPVRVSASP
jgi:hypothetical protein